MIINKAQGQTLNYIGVYLPQPVFGHGQLYVALSWCIKADDLQTFIKKGFIKDEWNIHMQHRLQVDPLK